MTKHIFVELLVRDGEREYNCPSVHTVGEDITVTEFGEAHAKGFYPNLTGEDEKTYEFDGGSVTVELYKAKEVTQEEFNVLKNYI